MVEMKESEIEWIGQIPKHWNIETFKYQLYRNEVKNKGDLTVLSLYRELGIVPKDSRDDNHNVTSEDTSKYKYVRIGDFVVNKMKAWQGSVAVSDYEGIVSPAYFVYSFRNNSFNKKYFHYLLRGCYKDEFRRLSGGIREGQWDLPADRLEVTPVIMPPKEEQNKIADFLDNKCAEIDSISAEIQEQINTLEEYMLSSITKLVTTGTNKDITLDNIDCEWLKQKPKDWDIKKLKYLFYFGKGLSITKEDLVEDGIPVISYGQVHSKDNEGTRIKEELIRFVPDSYLNNNKQSLVHKGDFIFADTSEDIEGAGNCVYIDKEMLLFAGYHSIILKNINKDCCIAEYLSYLFKTPLWRTQIRSRVTGIKVFSISQKILKELTVLIPPKEEQVLIVKKLNTICSDVYASIADKKKQLAILEEYKKTLIYEYVTGKKEVA